MAKPWVIAHHLIWTAYGWWLPNDPRGSMSRTIRNEMIEELGTLHHGRKRIQPASADICHFYDEAENRLCHPLTKLGKEETESVAEAFSATAHGHKYTCYACAIVPDHVHLLIRKHKHKAEQMIANFQSAGRLRLRELHLCKPDHLVWGGPGWKVFLDHPDDVHRTIRYIEDNPKKMRLPPQKWDFVTPYDNWPLHPGHDPDSPYARRLRDVKR